MRWTDAVKQLKAGNKIRRTSYPKGSYLHKTDPILHSSGREAVFSVKQFQAVDWEEYKEEKEGNWNLKDNYTFKVHVNSSIEEMNFSGKHIKKLQSKLFEDNKNNKKIRDILVSLQDNKISIGQTMDAIEEENKKTLIKRFGF